MIAEDYSIQHDNEYAEWQRQSSIGRELEIIAWKMVELALLDLRRKPDNYEYRSALDWLFNDIDFFFSFGNMCDLAGLDAKLIRCKLQEYFVAGKKLPRIRKKELKERKLMVE
uniref:Uncharacterized protein n=1 Tax=viral metagenome TaxID=1070528 RepID=A0A6M3LKU9_9ZZZZ